MLLLLILHLLLIHLLLDPLVPLKLIKRYELILKDLIAEGIFGLIQATAVMGIGTTGAFTDTEQPF